MSKKQVQRINSMIRVKEISLIGNDGEQLGVFPTQEALN
ncbi:MAG: translation initiation factor IF-3, partial [Nitrospina sp.]|nr:translation initiation factor IF-3 [Nitrospina sp.]